ncbi:MAG: hypothetical protein M1379_11825 [Firmicutes bacterium]|nr:hypothetical protein [Bacillota bacterium]
MNDQRPAILLDEGFARWRWTRGYVENVAAAIVLAVADEHATGRIYNVGEPETLSMAEWAREVGKAAGWNGEVIVLPKDRLPAHMVMDSGANQDILVDSTRIRKELGYREPVPMDEALRRTIAWERANPPEKIDSRMYDYDAEDAVLAELKKQTG